MSNEPAASPQGDTMKNILDDVLSAQMEAERDDFDPQRTIGLLLADLPLRAKSIVTERFGLNGKPKKTLEELGAMYSITRERVRQIESHSIKGFNSAAKKEILEPTAKVITSVLYDHGEIMEEEELIDTLLEGEDKDSQTNRNILLFLLDFLPDFYRIASTKKLRNAWALKGVGRDHAEAVIDYLHEYLKENKKTLSEDDLKEMLESDTRLQMLVPNHDVVTLISYLGLSRKIAKNPFGKWGLVRWTEVVPKGVRDKAYLVMREHKKPLHFTRITDRINKTHFDNRVAHPQTVHNELIKDDRFVLVGRGIYALKEWGYHEGTVADVLVEILKEESPLGRDELIKRVLEQRMVKRNTIIIGLQDKARFKKVEGNKYVLQDGVDKESQSTPA